VATTLTDSSGNYAFYDLPEGIVLCDGDEPCWLPRVSDIDGGDVNMITVTVGSGPLDSTGELC
jgi:hypothetical protein